MAEKSLYKLIKERQSAMADCRRPHEQPWEEVIKFCRPDLSEWDDESAESQGKKRNRSTYNASPEEGVEIWADGMQGNLASAVLAWFRLTSAIPSLNEISEVIKYFQEVEEVLYSVIRHSNFYPTLNPVFRNAASIGNAPMWIELNKMRDGITCSSFHPREVFIGESWTGALNQWHRGPFEKTALAAFAEFEEDGLSFTLKQAIELNKPLQRFKFIHAVYERTDPIFDNMTDVTLPDRPWISLYIQTSTEDKLEKPLLKKGANGLEGYFSKPQIYWRTNKASDSLYGYGPATMALVDIYAINSISRQMLIAGNMLVDPPMIGNAELRRQAGQIKPGGRVWTSSSDQVMAPLMANAFNYPAGVDREDRKQMSIDRRFLVPFFLMLQRAEREKTAFETGQIILERATLLGPKVERAESDLLSPALDRIFDIAQQMGWLPEPPQVLLDNSSGLVDVEFLGLLSQAQKQQLGSRKMQRVLTGIGPLAEADPEVLDIFNLKKTARRFAHDENWPVDEIRSEDEVAEIRQRRAADLAEQKQLAMADAVASQLPNLNQAPEAGSPMEQVTGAAG